MDPCALISVRVTSWMNKTPSCDGGKAGSNQLLKESVVRQAKVFVSQGVP